MASIDEPVRKQAAARMGVPDKEEKGARFEAIRLFSRPSPPRLNSTGV